MKPTQEQVIAWAREAGMNAPREIVVNNYWTADYDDIERFATLAYAQGRKDENEACAKVAENRWLDKANCTAEEMYEMQKKSIADAIRARREQ